MFDDLSMLIKVYADLHEMHYNLLSDCLHIIEMGLSKQGKIHFGLYISWVRLDDRRRGIEGSFP